MKTGAGMGCAALAAAALCCAPLACRAQITLDGTLGRPTPVLTGPNYAIGANLGRQLGGNLFHSFGQFNVLTGQSATFSGPASVSNIIGRVTGGSASSIDGVLRSTISGANLWLVNPGGVMFGPNASLEVSGAFHASSADYLRLGADGRFDARTPGASVLSAASPSAFGFVAAQPAAVSVNGASLGIAHAKALSLVGGDVAVRGGTIRSSGGPIHIASMAGPGEVPVEPSAAMPAGWSGGTITLAGAFVDTVEGPAAQPVGTIAIRGGRLVLSDTTINHASGNAASAGALSLEAQGAIEIGGGFVASASYGLAPGPAVALRAGSLRMENGAQINTEAAGGGAAGAISVEVAGRAEIGAPDAGGFPSSLGSATSFLNLFGGPPGAITLRARELAMRDGAAIQSTSFSPQQAGTITIDVNSLLLERGAGIRAATALLGAGAPIAVRASGSVELSGSQLVSGVRFPGGILSASEGFGGRAGDVSIQTGRLVVRDGAAVVAETSGAGDAGSIGIRAGTIELANRGVISASTAGAGRGGGIDVRAERSIAMSGDSAAGTHSGISSVTASTAPGAGAAGTIYVSAPEVRMQGSFIQAQSDGAGNAGEIRAEVGRIELRGGSQVSAGSRGDGLAGNVVVLASESVLAEGRSSRGEQSGFLVKSQGHGSGATGSVRVVAPRIVLREQGAIVGQTSGSYDGGEVAVEAGELALLDGGRLDATTFGAGRGGNIRVAVSGTLTIAGVDSSGASESAIIAASVGSGASGSVFVSARDIVISERAGISAEAHGSGLAGSLSVHASGTLRLFSGGRINTAALSSDGGNIAIRAKTLVYLRDSQITTSVGAGQGSGGNISIDPVFVVLDDSQIIANAFGGSGGNITIVSDFFLKSPDSLVQASSRFGLQGSISVSAPNVDVSAGLAVLPSAFFDASSMMRASCSARAARASNSFTGVGRGGLPASPAQLDFGSYAGALTQDAAAGSGPLYLASAPALGCQRYN